MSSTVCRCYGGTACPAASSEAEDFFMDIHPDKLAAAVADAVSDYVRLRGLHGLCPDVRKWSSPPGPAAFLDAGLPKNSGTASLPHGLSANPIDALSLPRKTGRGPTISRGRRGRDRRANSIPSPTWEEKGPEGSVSQVLSFDEIGEWGAVTNDSGSGAALSGPGEDVGETRYSLMQTSCDQGLAGSRSTPELGGRVSDGSMAGKTIAESPSVDAKQLLRSLRQQTANNYRHRQSRSQSGARPNLPGRGPGASPGNHAMFGSKRAFSPPDAWDDTGLFTVAPRPKTVPSGRTRGEQHALVAGVARFSPRPLLTPSVVGDSADCKRDLLRKPIDSAGRSLRGVGFGLWSKRRRELGGGAGDAAVEFLDVREAALVSVMEALARRALPWQAQLCPRALQDLEVARVRVFHTAEGVRQEGCEARQEALLRGLLLGEERSWELFAREQGRLFENALEQISDCVKSWEAAHVADLAIRVDGSKARAQRAENHDRYSTDHFEDSETERAWLHRRSTQVDIMWEPSTNIQGKQAEAQRAAAAREKWSKAQGWVMVRGDASTWLEAAGARALASQELARWELGVTEMTRDDEDRATDDRAKERQRVTESYLSVLQSAWEADRDERATSAESWNLQGWLSVGSHKLVQQTLRALVRRCHHPYTVRDILWEARQAAEFASSARAAAASQRAADARVLCSSRSERKATVREHKRDFLQAEEKRASDEDAERARTVQQLAEALRASALARTGEAQAQLQGERARVIASREKEAARSALYQEETVALAREVDRETERVAASLRERRDEEEHQSKSEVSAAESALKEEQARADGREALHDEMMLRERGNEDRLLREWVGHREREESNAVARHIADTAKRLAEERERWAMDLTASIAAMATLDTSFLRDPLTWRTEASSTTTLDSGTTTVSLNNSRQLLEHELSAIWVGVNAREEAARIELVAAVAFEDAKHEGVERATAAAEVEARAASTRGARVESLAALTCQGLAAHWRYFWRDDIERARLAAAAGDMVAARWEQRQNEAAGAFWVAWRNRTWNGSVKTEATKATAETSTRTEVLADAEAEVGAGAGPGEEKGARAGHEKEQDEQEVGARERKRAGSRKGERVESAVGVAAVAPVLDVGQFLHGQRAHAEQKNAEQTRSMTEEIGKNNDDGSGGGTSAGRDVAEALLGNTDRGEERKGAFGASVHEKHNEGVNSVGIGGNVEVTPHASPVDAVSLVADAAARATDAPGGSISDGEPTESTEPDGTADDGLHTAAKRVARAASDASNDILTVAICRVEAAGRGTNANGTFPPGVETAVTAHELVVYVGNSTARHLSTFRRSYMENFDDHRRRCSRFAAQRSSVLSSTGSATDDDIVGSENHDMEAEWLKVLEGAVGENELTDLAELGGSLGKVPGGVAVLCLTHDCIVDDDRELEGFVRAEILLPAAEALVTIRRRMRAEGLLAAETETAERSAEMGENGGLTTLAVLSAVAKMEAALEFDVLGEELGADLANIFTCSGESTLCHGSQTAGVRRALQKHGALLSPQSICALTALLSARGRSWADNGGGFTDGVCGGSACSSAENDMTAWKKAVSNALLAVRTATLEHVAMWAKACDPEKTESACRAHVAESTVSRSNNAKEQGCPKTLVDDPTEAMWSAMHSVSGLGLSSLMLSAATLPNQGAETPPSLVGPGSAPGKGETISTDGGSGDAGRGRKAVDLVSTLMRSTLRLLTSHSLNNVARCLSQCQTTAITSSSQEGTDSSHLIFDAHTPEILSHIPGHPAIGDLSGLNAETLRKGAAGLITALDTRNTGVLPPAALLVALQGGQAGFRLESAQARVVLRLAGCPGSAHNEIHGDHRSAAIKATAADTMGGYCYLGYPPGTASVRFSPLVDKIPGLLRLVQAAHRLHRAAEVAVAPDPVVGSTDCATLERAREDRRKLEVEMGAAVNAAALEAVCRRMEYLRLQGRSAMLEAPQLEAMQRLSAHAQEISSAAANTRSIELSRRTELRGAFTAAVQERTVAVSSTTSTIIPAMAAATVELWSTGGQAMEKARDCLTHTVERVGEMVTEAQERLVREECVRTAEDDEARELQNEAPEWWGEGLAQEVEASYRHEAMWGQETATGLLEAASELERDMGATWEEDAEQCKDAFAETEKKLDVVMADYEERRVASKEAMGATRKDAMSLPQQADFAELVQTRHEGITLCRENLTWLGVAANDLEAECVELCTRAEGMPTRAEKRLDGMLKTAAAVTAKERSVVARRLHAVSNTWGEDIPQRTRRWGELRGSRREAYERNRSTLEAAHEKSGSTAPVATLARTTALAQGQQTAEAIVKHYLDGAGHGATAAEAKATATTAARAITQSQEAVSNSVAAAGAERELKEEDCEARAAEVSEIESEDTAVKVRVCQTAVQEWWTQLAAAVEEGLHRQEKEIEERRVRREVRHLLSGSLVSEAEAGHKADTLAKKILGFVLAQSQRVAEQFVAGERSATKRATAAAADARAAIDRETQVLSLEARALSQRVSAMVQQGLDAAAEDLVAAQRKDKDRGKESHLNGGSETLEGDGVMSSGRNGYGGEGEQGYGDVSSPEEPVVMPAGLGWSSDRSDDGGDRREPQGGG